MIKFYTTYCPKCKVLKRIMDDKGIEFEIIDDVAEIHKVAEEFNLSTVPFADIGGVMFDTKNLTKYIMEVK